MDRERAPTCPPAVDSAAEPTLPEVEKQIRRLHWENERLLGCLDRIESLWVTLQKRGGADRLPLDLLGMFLSEVDNFFPVVLCGAYRVELPDREFKLERRLAADLCDDLEAEVQRQIAAGHFALALRRSRPTVCPRLGVHRYHPRVRAVVLVPLVTLAEVHGMGVFATERAERDISSYDLKLLSVLAGQTALAVESAEREAALRRHNLELEEKVRARTAELEDKNRTVRSLNEQLEAELKKALEVNERLSAVERARESLLATASHELRTPLSAIMGSLEILREEWGDRLPREGRGLLDICQRNSGTLLSLVSDLLDVAQMNDGHVELRPRVTALSSVVGNAFDSVAPLAQANGVRLLNCVLPGVEVYADAQRIHQVLLNLVGNAI